MAVCRCFLRKHGFCQLHRHGRYFLRVKGARRLVASYVFPVKTVAACKQVPEVRGNAVTGQVAATTFCQELLAKSIAHLLQKRIMGQRGKPLLASGLVN